MTTPYKHHASSVIPAQLSFLAIYNPTLGPTDETFADQLVFWYSRKASEARRAEKTGDAAGSDARRKAADREEEHERLRQIGLAQGMIGFAKTFSDGEKPVESIETDKSRVVLHELENGWWILASIDLTRLPAPAPASAGKSKNDENEKPALEYSSREVSSPALLTQQLMQAHWVFLLHHGPTLDELFVKLSRDKFCATLERYWSRFARSWDVILHGNPAVDVFGGIKLAAGGELGVGVGEETWGSGEREVLEDLTRRTEGLLDVVVARFGEPAPDKESSVSETNELPWLGSGNIPTASDGIVFAGLDKLNRPSVRSISLWMQHIYAYGDYAYGVKDNPSRERRKRRRLKPPPGTNGSATSPKLSGQPNADDLRQRVQQHEAARSGSPMIDQDLLPKDQRPQMYDRVASYDHATGTSTPQSASHPEIPPPIVTAAEQALNKATKSADSRSTHESTYEADDNTTMGIPDQYMKYMTFGLSSLAKSYNKKQQEPNQSSTAGSKNTKPPDSGPKPKAKNPTSASKKDEPALSHAEPIPEGEELRAKIAQQIQAENEGHFVIGLKGDLSADTPSDSNDHDAGATTEGSHHEESGGSRNILRTVQVELTAKEQTYSDKVNDDLERGDEVGNMTGHLAPENPITKDFRRLRVLIYVCRPFMFAFLFEQRTSSLSYASLYKTLHNTLKPIHKRLLASTSPESVASRLQEVSQQQQNQPQQHNITANPTDEHENPIFSLLYDPATLSLHSTIPNIPPPGSYKPWPRLDALNVHASLLATLAATSGPKAETALERTSKTARGWWVVWLRLPPSVALDDARPTNAPRGSGDSNAPAGSEADYNGPALDSRGGAISTLGLGSSITPRASSVGATHRVALLVRKAGGGASGLSSSPSAAVQSKAAAGGSGGGGRLGSGMWSSLGIRRGSASTSLASSSGGGGGGEEGSGGLGVGGFGVDARKYVEGLLSLNR